MADRPGTSYGQYVPPTDPLSYFNALPPGQIPIFASRGRHVTTHCTLCDAVFTDGKSLHKHRMRVHKVQLGGGQLQDPPFEEGEDPFAAFPDGAEMNELYQDSELYILEPNILEDPVFKSFNFPINGTVTNEEVEKQMREIYDDSSMNKSYKLEISPGFIMKSTENGELRYFKPSGNAYILENPLLIDSRETLDAAIRYLNSIELDDMIRNYRPSTKYQVLYITQLTYHVWLTDFPIGAYKIHKFLPQYLVANRYVDTSVDYAGLENCCAFICLAQYRKLQMNREGKNKYNSSISFVKRQAKVLVKQWVSYCQENNIQGYRRSTPTNFPGLQWDHLAHFEDAFKVNVNVMEMSPDRSVQTVYKTVAEYEDTMHVNLYKDHFNLITNVKLYSRKFKCKHCMTLFKTNYLLMRHERTCSSMTKFVFPSGAYKTFKSVFQELEELGISVPESDRYYDYFMVYDLEAVLKPRKFITKSGKTKFINEHVPISVSVSSNVHPFDQPHCIINSNPHEIVRQMFQHFDEIRQETNKLVYTKWGLHLERLEELINSRFMKLQSRFSEEVTVTHAKSNSNCTNDDVVEDSAESSANNSRMKKFVKYLKRDVCLSNMLRIYKRFYRYMYRTVILSFNGQKYDVHLISSYMIKYFLDRNEQVSEALIKQVCQVKNSVNANFVQNSQHIPHTHEHGPLTQDDVSVTGAGEEPMEYDSSDSDSDEQSESEDEHESDHADNSIDSQEFDLDHEIEEILGGFGNELEQEGDEWSVTIDEVLERNEMKKPGQINVLKRNNCYVHFGNAHYIMLDVTNWLAPGTSYSKFLTAYGVQEKKFFFPYQALKSSQDLSSWIPEYQHESWRNSLRNNVHLMEQEYIDWENQGRKGSEPRTGQQNYTLFKEVCEANNLKTLRDLLQFYNNADVQPFVKGVQNMLSEYNKLGLDIFKDTFGTPGASRIMLMRSAQKSNTFFPLFNNENCDLYFLFKRMSTGGPAIIHQRYAEIGKTYLRPDKEQKVNGIFGYDCNAMYLSVLSGQLPTTMYVRRKAADNFKPVYRRNYLKMLVWLELVAEETGEFVRSKGSNGYETRVLNYLVDGMIVKKSGKVIALEFLGCMWHQHKKIDPNCCLSKRDAPQKDAYDQWVKKRRDLLDADIEVWEMWECKFNEILDQNPKYRKRLNELKPPFLKKHPYGEVSQETILRAIHRGEYHGFVLVDVSVPKHMRSFFDIMPPIFANSVIPHSMWSKVMKEKAEEHGISKHDRTLLVSGFEAKEILLNDVLARYYLELGLEITQIHQCIEFTPRSPFKAFADEVTANRLAASRGNSRQIVGDLFKLIGKYIV